MKWIGAFLLKEKEIQPTLPNYKTEQSYARHTINLAIADLSKHVHLLTLSNINDLINLISKTNLVKVGIESDE